MPSRRRERPSKPSDYGVDARDDMAARIALWAGVGCLVVIALAIAAGGCV